MKKENDRSDAEEKRWVFSFDLKEESELDERLTERGRKFRCFSTLCSLFLDILYIYIFLF